MGKSIIQTDQIKRCFITEQRCSNSGAPLHKHHIINGSLRDWAEQEGLWIYLTPEIHDWLHTNQITTNGLKMLGSKIQNGLMKQLAEYAYIVSKMPPQEVEKAKKDWLEKVHRNYV